MEKLNNIDLALESFANRGVDNNVRRFNYIEEDEWELDYQDLYENILNEDS